MITPRKRRELPFTLNLNLALIDSFDTDDPKLAEYRQAFVEAIHFVLMEHPRLEKLIKDGRIESIPIERNQLLETLNQKGAEINAHQIDKARILNVINAANKEQAEAKAAFNALNDHAPIQTRVTDRQWANYQKELEAAGYQLKLADRKASDAQLKLPTWKFQLGELQSQYDAIEQRIKVLDYDKDVLTGKIDPNDLNKRMHDPNTGLQVRGPGAGFIRSS